MTKLEQIEILRKELLGKVLEMTDLPMDDVEVCIHFLNPSKNRDLIIEALNNWQPETMVSDSPWYTSGELPGGQILVRTK